MLDALWTALQDFAATDQVTAQVTDQVANLLGAMWPRESASAGDLMARLDLKHRQSFRALYLGPALTAGLIAMSAPDRPRSPAQRYSLTDKGKRPPTSSTDRLT